MFFLIEKAMEEGFFQRLQEMFIGEKVKLQDLEVMLKQHNLVIMEIVLIIKH